MERHKSRQKSVAPKNKKDPGRKRGGKGNSDQWTVVGMFDFSPGRGEEWIRFKIETRRSALPGLAEKIKEVSKAGGGILDLGLSLI
jgi:hypothetical protein